MRNVSWHVSHVVLVFFLFIQHQSFLSIFQQVGRYRVRDLQYLMQFTAKAAEVPTTTPIPTVQAEEDGGGLAVWLIVVIVIACLLCIALVVTIVFFVVM